jgi:hypothetical protein
MVGRNYTLEDEIDVLHEDLGRARRHLTDLEYAETQGRVTDWEAHAESLRKARERVAMLEVELREACADQIAAAEGFAQ